MKKLLGMILIAGATSAVALAGGVVAPEIDATTGVAALGLLAGAALVIRGRRKK